MRLCGLVLAAMLAAGAWGAEVKVNPKATYLRTNQDNGSLNAPAVSLESLGVAPGDWARLERVGLWGHVGGQGETKRRTHAVFSAGDVLLAPDQAHRVPGAIAAGLPSDTGETWFGKLETDIPEDFAVDDGVSFASADVRVPAGATHVFFTAGDSLFGDNFDNDGDYKVLVSVLACYPDYNGDGLLDLFDFLAFVNGFNAGEGRADCDGSRAFDLFDFLCFVNEFNGAC